MRLVFIGPPGAGKGTQSARLCHHFSITHLSTGDILRESVNAGTEIGKVVGPLMKDGQLVNDDLMTGVVRERLAKDDCENGFLLDGFPRTVPQAEALVDLIEELKWTLDRVVEIRVPKEELTRRLTGRAQQTDAPRDDDSNEAIPKRLDIFYTETRPLIDFYEKRSQLLTVDGVGTMDQVFERIINGLDSRVPDDEPA